MQIFQYTSPKKTTLYRTLSAVIADNAAVKSGTVYKHDFSVPFKSETYSIEKVEVLDMAKVTLYDLFTELGFAGFEPAINLKNMCLTVGGYQFTYKKGIIDQDGIQYKDVGDAVRAAKGVDTLICRECEHDQPREMYHFPCQQCGESGAGVWLH